MTIDERLDKLTERHEALAQSLELNASLQRDHDQRVGQAIEALNHAIETLASLHADNERRMGGMMDAVTRLSNIVADHDIRLDSLEGRP
jgi:ABC-type transporter Mla subunit MlaD